VRRRQARPRRPPQQQLAFGRLFGECAVRETARWTDVIRASDVKVE
jgi:hypothetical protein